MSEGHARKTTLLVGVLLSMLGASLPATCWATQKIKLKAAFNPDKLGAGTTVQLRVTVSTTTGAVPSPATDMDISLPAGMGLGATNLGEATCNAAALEAEGRSACPANSQVGIGDAIVELPFEPDPVQDQTRLTVYMGEPVEEHTTMLFYAESYSPVQDELLFQGQLLPGLGRFGAHLNTRIPPIRATPESRDASVISLRSTIGPEGVRYYRHVHGKLVGYSPRGMAVPDTCPRGGFPFRAKYLFQDGTAAVATNSVPCPRGHAASRSTLRHR